MGGGKFFNDRAIDADLEALARLLKQSTPSFVPQGRQIGSEFNNKAKFKLAVLNSKVATNEFIKVRSKRGFVLDRLSSGKLCRIMNERRRAFKKKVLSAALSGAKVIISGEMTHPHQVFVDDLMKFYSGAAEGAAPTGALAAQICLKDKKRYEDFRKDLIEISRKHGCLILAGSYHCYEEGYSVTPMYIEGTAIDHHKIRGAEMGGPSRKGLENIRPKETKFLPVYSSKFGGFCVLVCSDAHDITASVRIMMHNLNPKNQSEVDILAERCQVIFVPSYNPARSDIRDACQNLSKLADCFVVHANSDPSTGELGNLFVRGQERESKKKKDFAVFEVDLNVLNRQDSNDLPLLKKLVGKGSFTKTIVPHRSARGAKRGLERKQLE